MHVRALTWSVFSPIFTEDAEHLTIYYFRYCGLKGYTNVQTSTRVHLAHDRRGRS
jgi:hypothetical protein